MKETTNRVRVSQVSEDALLSHELAVDNHGQVDIEDDVVVNGEPKDDTDQCELAVILKRHWVEPESMSLF